jgi:hypothetical protein
VRLERQTNRLAHPVENVCLLPPPAPSQELGPGSGPGTFFRGLMETFNGSDYVAERDDERLSSQLERVKALMSDSQWRSLNQIASATGAPAASVSAQLRHLRKERFGSNTVNKRYVERGVFLYQLIMRD